MSFLKPSQDISKVMGESEGVHYGSVITKISDPKKQGRVKVRVPELHGDESSGIPDEALPWTMLERPIGHGNNPNQSTYGIPQQNSMVKMRFHGDGKYSPLGSGAPYSTPGAQERWNVDNQKDIYGWEDFAGGNPDKNQDAGNSQGGSGGGSGTARELEALASGGSGGSGGSQGQQKHGNYIHVDTKKKEMIIDFTKLNKVTWHLPKTIFNIKDTSNKEGQSPSDSGSGQQKSGGAKTQGNLTWNVDGAHSHNIGNNAGTGGQEGSGNPGDHSVTIGGNRKENYSGDHSTTVGGNKTRTVSKSISSKGQGRTDSYGGSWSAQASLSTWSWLLSLDDITGPT